MAENYSNFWITLFYSSSPSLPLLIPTNHNWYLFFYTSNFIKNISTGFLIGEWGYFGNFTYDWESECVWERASTMVLLLWREGGADWVFEYEDLVLTQIWVVQIEKEHRVGLWLKRKTKPKTSWVYKKQWFSLSLSLSISRVRVYLILLQWRLQPPPNFELPLLLLLLLGIPGSSIWLLFPPKHFSLDTKRQHFTRS